MFLGHFGVGFGAKAAAPKASLGTLFLAAQFVDLLWPTLLLVGLEKVVIAPGITRVTPLDFTDYPITHSLIAAIVWAALFAGAYFLMRKYPKGAWICGAAVLSHWVLDLLTHRPDLPLVPGGTAKGRSRAVELVAGHAGCRTRDLCGRCLALRPDDPSSRSHRNDRTVVSGRVLARRLLQQPVRPSPAQRYGNCLVGTSSVAPRDLGILDRPPPGGRQINRVLTVPTARQQLRRSRWVNYPISVSFFD